MSGIKKPRVEVCGHISFFAPPAVNLLKVCICKTCGHRWAICLLPNGKVTSDDD